MIDDDYPIRSSLWEMIERRADATPELQLAADEAGRRITFGVYRDQVLRCAAGLHARGVQPGSTLSWILPTWIEATIITGALDRLGVRQNPILPIYREREVGFIVRQLGVDAMITPTAWRGFGFSAMAKGLVANVIAVDRGEPLPEGDPSTLPPPPDDPERVPWVLYTSGTTAEPKGVMHKHRSIATMTQSMCKRLRVAAADRSALPFPFSHLGGINWLMATMMTGCCVILIENFADPVSIPALAREGVTLAGATTAFHMAYLAAQRAQPDTPLFPKVRAFPGGAAPKPPQLSYDLAREVGGVGIVAGYGLTEGAMLSMASIDDPPAKLAHTEGRPSDGIELIVLDDHGSPVAPGTDGEIRVRGPHMAVGYVDPELTRAGWDENGFFKTGDIGHLDEDGYVVISGRLKDVIIRKGENVSAKEIEDLLYEHPKVVDVAVIGLPSGDDRGELVCAIVACRPDREPLTFDEMVAHLTAQRLTTRKLPERLEVVDALPRNPNGKIPKHELRERFASTRDR